MKIRESLILSVLFVVAFSIAVVGCGKEKSTSPASLTAKTVEQEKVDSLAMIDFKVIRNEAGKLVVKGSVKNLSNQKISHATAKFKLLDNKGSEIGETIANVDNLEVQFSWIFEAAIADESTVAAKFLGFAVK